MPEMPSPYPSRPNYFANHFVRVMAKACLANEIGAEACWLLAVIALTEDAKRYRDPVTFFNEQLMPLVGVKNVKSLDRIRTKAVESGWLNYIAGGKGKAGRYWVEIPQKHRNWDDEPTDEGNTSAGYSWSKTTKEPGENRQRSGEETAREVGREPGENRQRSGQHSSYTQDPLPEPLPPPPGEGGEGGAMVGPKPADVVAHWNSFPGLTPCVASDPHRDRFIRSWATGNPLWVAHWRGVIAFMGRTLLYCGGGEKSWRATLGWLFKDDHFATLVERMIAEQAMPPPTIPFKSNGKQTAADVIAAKRAEREKRQKPTEGAA